MTSISTLGQSLTQIERLKSMQLQLGTLQTQLATGKKTQLFKGLGTDVIASERARANVKALVTYNNNIDIADRRLKMMINAIQKIKQQAGNVVNAIQIQTQQGEFELDSVGDLAAKSKDFVTSLLNEKDGDRFLFGGAETRAQPIKDTGTLDTYLQTQLNDWINTTIDTDQLVTSYRDRTALNDTITGYSAELSSGNAKHVFVRVEEDVEIDYTVFGNDGAFRDIVVAMGMLDNLAGTLDEVTLDPEDNPATTVTAPGITREEQNDNFYQMFNDLAAMINNALDGLETVEFKLSQVEAKIAELKENNGIEKNILENTIGEVEDADMSEVALSLNVLQTQMEASFRVTASIRDLSLANFI